MSSLRRGLTTGVELEYLAASNRGLVSVCRCGGCLGGRLRACDAAQDCCARPSRLGSSSITIGSFVVRGGMSTESHSTIAQTPSRRVAASTFVDVVRFRAETEAEQLAYRLASDDDSEVKFLTYGDLDRSARSMAVLLKRAASPGDRALLLFQPGLDFISAFFGCLYAGVVAVPVLPPRPNRGLPRLERILEDSGATVGSDRRRSPL